MVGKREMQEQFLTIRMVGMPKMQERFSAARQLLVRQGKQGILTVQE
jgi:hypothetical protein